MRRGRYKKVNPPKSLQATSPPFSMWYSLAISSIGAFLAAITNPVQAYDVWFFESEDCSGTAFTSCDAIQPSTCCEPSSGTLASVYFNCNKGDSWHTGPLSGGMWCNCDGQIVGQGPACVTYSKLGGPPGCGGYFT